MSELYESQLYIDGKLRSAQDGRRYGNIAPTTEQAAGYAADASPADMDAAIAAARRAFDETDWSTNLNLRIRCLEQLRDRLKESADANRPRVSAETGAPIDDADLSRSLQSGLTVCYHAGQGCAIPTRILLPKSRYEEAIGILKTLFENFVYGDPNAMDQIMGPLISKVQQKRVLNYIKVGREEGARVVTGGGVPARLPKGYYVEPTLFADVDSKMRIAQEEIFGPVLVAIPYDDDDDAVRIANDSIYGLNGQVHSADVDRALSVGRRIRAGMVNINSANAFAADSPFGGYKQSGIGREMGVEGFEEYLQTKAIGVPA